MAQHMHNCTREDTICVYTDGSGIDGHVGAAAVMLLAPDSPNGSTLHKRISYVGKVTESTVYAAERNGIHLALQILIANSDPHRRRITIFTDNQSALMTIRRPGNMSGQYILRELLQALEEVMTAGMEV
jgi:hypothetical protein